MNEDLESSIVNEVIRVILNLFVFFMRKFYTHKKHKNIKTIKNIKTLDKRLSSSQMFFIHIKSIKTLNKQTSDFFLDAFYVHKNVAFFIFVCLFNVLCFFMLFMLVKCFCKKNPKRFKITLITSITILLRFIPFHAYKKLFVRTYFYL